MKPRGWAARVAIAAALCALVAGAGWLWRGRSSDARAPAYLTETVERGELAAHVTATGVVEPVATVVVGSYVSGPIRALYADFNSEVARGQLVAKIDPAPFEMRVRQAEANLANARAKLDKARADLARKQASLERSRELRARGILSEDGFELAVSEDAQARAQLALEEAGVAQAQAGLEEARIQLGYTDIVSPVDGVVISRSVDVGQTVAASFQTPTLFEIAEDLSRMRVRASVSEADIGGVAEAQDASFAVDAFPRRRFEGQVVQVRIAPVTLQNVVTYDVVIEVANPSRELKPGMTANVEITTAHRDDALRVPLRALRFRPDAEAAAPAPNGAESAFVLEEGGALRRVEVRTGIRDERFAEVVGGELAAGDAVVVAMERASPSDEPAASSPFQPRRRR